METPRIPPASRAVLQLFLTNPDTEMYGAGITKKIGMPHSTIYPILSRYLDQGMLSRREESVEEARQGQHYRTRRLYYRLTPQGRKRAQRLVERTLARKRSIRAYSAVLAHELRLTDRICGQTEEGAWGIGEVVGLSLEGSVTIGTVWAVLRAGDGSKRRVSFPSHQAVKLLAEG